MDDKRQGHQANQGKQGGSFSTSTTGAGKTAGQGDIGKTDKQMTQGSSGNKSKQQHGDGRGTADDRTG